MVTGPSRPVDLSTDSPFLSIVLLSWFFPRESTTEFHNRWYKLVTSSFVLDLVSKSCPEVDVYQIFIRLCITTEVETSEDSMGLGNLDSRNRLSSVFPYPKFPGRCPGVNVVRVLTTR